MDWQKIRKIQQYKTTEIATFKRPCMNCSNINYETIIRTKNSTGSKLLTGKLQN